MPKIIVHSPGAAEDYTYPCDERETTIGRLTSNAVVLAAASVSRHHATIIAEAGDYYCVDAGSDNGTKVNDIVLRANERYLLRDGDTITIGEYRLRFYRLDERLEQSFNEITDSDIMEVKLLKKVLRALDKETVPSLEVLNGVAEGRKHFFADDQETIVVGRDPMVDFPIEEYVISRRHAKFIKRPEGIAIQDTGSKNGTYVNNDRITTETVLRDGDRVAFGTIVCIFRNPRDVNLAAVSERLKAHRQRARPKRPVADTEIPSPLGGEGEGEGKFSEGVALTAEDAPESTATGAETVPDPDEFAARERAHDYPTPHAATKRLRFSPFEMGLLWAGTIVFLVTVILLVQLLT